jgi:hypothetical protein
MFLEAFLPKREMFLGRSTTKLEKFLTTREKRRRKESFLPKIEVFQEGSKTKTQCSTQTGNILGRMFTQKGNVAISNAAKNTSFYPKGKRFEKKNVETQSFLHPQGKRSKKRTMSAIPQNFPKLAMNHRTSLKLPF